VRIESGYERLHAVLLAGERRQRNRRDDPLVLLRAGQALSDEEVAVLVRHSDVRDEGADDDDILPPGGLERPDDRLPDVAGRTTSSISKKHSLNFPSSSGIARTGADVPFLDRRDDSIPKRRAIGHSDLSEPREDARVIVARLLDPYVVVSFWIGGTLASVIVYGIARDTA
jgi:hypothetical protein